MNLVSFKNFLKLIASCLLLSLELPCRMECFNVWSNCPTTELRYGQSAYSLFLIPALRIQEVNINHNIIYNHHIQEIQHIHNTEKICIPISILPSVSTDILLAVCFICLLVFYKVESNKNAGQCTTKQNKNKDRKISEFFCNLKEKFCCLSPKNQRAGSLHADSYNIHEET